MPRIQEKVVIGMNADQLWREIGSFQGVAAWHPRLTRVQGNGEQPGALRRAESGNAQQQLERLKEINPARRYYRYELLESSMPVAEYRAELRVLESSNDTCTVVWSADFDVTNGDEKKTVGAIREFMLAGLDNLKQRFGRRRRLPHAA